MVLIGRKKRPYLLGHRCSRGWKDGRGVLTDLLSQLMDHWEARERGAEQGSSLLAKGLAQRLLWQPTALVAGAGPAFKEIQASRPAVMIPHRVVPGVRSARTEQSMRRPAARASSCARVCGGALDGVGDWQQDRVRRVVYPVLPAVCDCVPRIMKRYTSSINVKFYASSSPNQLLLAWVGIQSSVHLL